jgi:hypothetical protein
VVANIAALIVLTIQGLTAIYLVYVWLWGRTDLAMAFPEDEFESGMLGPWEVLADAGVAAAVSLVAVAATLACWRSVNQVRSRAAWSLTSIVLVCLGWSAMSLAGVAPTFSSPV